MCMVIDMEHLYHVIYSSCNAIVHNSNPTPDPNNNYKPSATIINLSFITIPRAFQPHELVALEVGFSKFVVVLGDPTSRPKDGLLRERQVPSCRVLLEKARSTDVLDLLGGQHLQCPGDIVPALQNEKSSIPYHAELGLDVVYDRVVLAPYPGALPRAIFDDILIIIIGASFVVEC